MPRSIVNPATSLTNPANTPVPKGKNTLGKDDFLKNQHAEKSIDV